MAYCVFFFWLDPGRRGRSPSGSVRYASLPFWASATTATLLPWSWMAARSDSSVTCSGVNQMQETFLKPSRLHAWWETPQVAPPSNHLRGNQFSCNETLLLDLDGFMDCKIFKVFILNINQLICLLSIYLNSKYTRLCCHIGILRGNTMTSHQWSQIQVAEAGFLRRVASVSLKDKVRSSVICEILGVEPLLLRVERSQLRLFRHLVRSLLVASLWRSSNPPLPGPSEEISISALAGERLGMNWLMWPGKGKSGTPCWNCSLHDTTPDKWLTMDGWMIDGQTDWRTDGIYKSSVFGFKGVFFFFLSLSGPVSEVSGGSDSSSPHQVMACDPVKGQTGQLHGRRRLSPSHIPSPWQQQWHHADSEGNQEQWQQQQCEEGDDGVLRNFPKQTGHHILMSGAGPSETWQQRPPFLQD